MGVDFVSWEACYLVYTFWLADLKTCPDLGLFSKFTKFYFWDAEMNAWRSLQEEPWSVTNGFLCKPFNFCICKRIISFIALIITLTLKIYLYIPLHRSQDFPFLPISLHSLISLSILPVFPFLPSPPHLFSSLLSCHPAFHTFSSTCPRQAFPAGVLGRRSSLLTLHLPAPSPRISVHHFPSSLSSYTFSFSYLSSSLFPFEFLWISRLPLFPCYILALLTSC